jgi:hypothetical protein
MNSRLGRPNISCRCNKFEASQATKIRPSSLPSVFQLESFALHLQLGDLAKHLLRNCRAKLASVQKILSPHGALRRDLFWQLS